MMTEAASYSDEILWSLFKEGDKEAFTHIYNRYWEKLLAIAYRHTKNQAVAKDIVQNLFVSLWERKAHLEINNVAHYLAVAIKFAVFNQYYRKEKREASLKGRLSFKKETEIGAQIEAKFLEAYIHGLVEQLPPKCRLVFESSRFRHMNINEISGEMGIAPKTVEAHLTKALKILRHHLSESELALFFVLLSFVWG